MRRLAWSLFLWGPCAALAIATASTAPSGIQLQVPFFADQTDQCGPATLAGLLTFWGKPADPQRLKLEMYDAKLKGTLPMDLVRVARQHGLNAQMVEGAADQIKMELSAGRPVLVMLNMGFAAMPVGHYALVTGWDDQKKGFYLHSGGKPNQFYSFKKFEKKWKTVDHWAMVTQP